MEEIKIVYNRKLFFSIIIGIAFISWISLGIIPTILILGGLYFIFLYKKPMRFDWIIKPLIIFHLQKKGIKLYPYEKEIPWKDIDTYYVEFGFFTYYLCIKLRKDIVMTQERKSFYKKLKESNILNETNEWDKIIKYPYNFITTSTNELKSKIEMFLKEYSKYYLERSQDRLEIHKSIDTIIWAGIGGLFFINMLGKNAIVFIVTCLISIPIIFYFIMKTKNTPYLVFTEKGFELPQVNFKLDWNVIKLIEVQTGTRDTPGALIIWFNDIETFIKENPYFFSLSGDILLDYDEEKFKKTGRLRVKCSKTELGEDRLREEFQKYIDKYGQVTTQGENIQKYNKEEMYKSIYPEGDINGEMENSTNEIENNQSIELEKVDIKDNTIINISEEKSEVLSEDKTIVDPLENQEAEYNLELQKLVEIQFKSQNTFKEMILLKEEGEYCLAVRVEGLRLDGYCIFLKNQIRTLSYCSDFYNELLQKEYYFKLNTAPYIDLEKWERIFNSYQVRNHFIEINTLNENYKGKIKELSEGRMILDTLKIKDKGAFESISIDLNSITMTSFETSELMLLEKYCS